MEVEEGKLFQHVLACVANFSKSQQVPKGPDTPLLSYPSSPLPFVHCLHLCPDALVVQENEKPILIFSST